MAIDDPCNHVLWLKQIPLKINIFIWRLLMNRLETKMNLFRRNILDYNNFFCSAACRFVEDQDHLFFSCAFYGQLWLLISGWLGISTTLHGSLFQHFLQFGGFGGFSNKSHLTFNIIWILALFTIWKDHNMRLFHNKSEQLQSLLENVKLQAFYGSNLIMLYSILSIQFGG